MASHVKMIEKGILSLLTFLKATRFVLPKRSTISHVFRMKSFVYGVT